MLLQIVTENVQKKVIPLTADAGAGNPVGTIIPMYKKSSPSGYLYCDGSTFDETVYPALYLYLGSNVLPDYRECVMVGAEQNTTDTIAAHDVYTQGEFKDDQLQDHLHTIPNNNQGNGEVGGGNTAGVTNLYNSISTFGVELGTLGSRVGTTTHGKQKAVYVYIKATSGLAENQQENVLNTINENNSYSTEEHPTGKKWIDGKPIYSKVIDCGALPNNTETFTNLNIQNLATVVSLKGMANNGAGTFLPLPYMDASLTNCVQMAVANNKISIITNGIRSTFSAVAIVEYTKTTD